MIGKWDNDLRLVSLYTGFAAKCYLAFFFLSLDIIKHWVSLIDENGWVGREQILGEEARSKVPVEFQTQFPHYANPPTLLLAIKRYVDRLARHDDGIMESDNTLWKIAGLDDPEVLRNLHVQNPTMARAWLESVYPKLRLNWQWFRATQRGHLERFNRVNAPSKEVYRWRGRTPEHTLTSGLDDYPRGEPPNVGELHADLLCWMAFATGLLKDIATQLGPDYATHLEEYAQIQQDMLSNLDALHWSTEHQAYCDQTIEEGTLNHIRKR